MFKYLFIGLFKFFAIIGYNFRVLISAILFTIDIWWDFEKTKYKLPKKQNGDALMCFSFFAFILIFVANGWILKSIMLLHMVGLYFTAISYDKKES